MESIKFLSIIVPAYRQEKTIIEDIKSIESALSKLSFDYEIIIVVDGFVDNTYEKAKKLENKNIKVLGYERNYGKGHAVRYGILKGKGDVLGFIDAGMDINPQGIQILLDLMIWNNADIVIGSKLHSDSKINYPEIRKLYAWGYRTLTHLLFGFSVKDTQVGLKFFRRAMVRKVFPKLLIKTFAFDVEILAVAYSLGFSKIYEGPVELKFNKSSSIGMGMPWKIIFLMLWDTFAVFYRLKILNYYRNER